MTRANIAAAVGDIRGRAAAIAAREGFGRCARAAAATGEDGAAMGAERLAAHVEAVANRRSGCRLLGAILAK